VILAEWWSSGTSPQAIAAVIGAVVGLVGGFLLELWRNKVADKKDQESREEELRTAARSVAGAFTGAAAALRVAGRSNGSLNEWRKDDDTLSAHVDRIRRDASSERWTEIEKRLRLMDHLRDEQLHNRVLGSTEDYTAFAESLEKTAEHVLAEWAAS
jgi:hypothetical protein